MTGVNGDHNQHGSDLASSTAVPWGDSVVSGSPPAGPAAPPAPSPPPGALPAVSARAPQSRWTSKRIAILVVSIVVMVIIVVVGAIFAFLGLSATSVDMSVPRDAEIGECFDRFEESQRAVSCEGVHHYEVYSAIFYPLDMEYPSRWDRLGGDVICEEDFEIYTGENFWTSQLDYSIPLPTETEWANGERETVCVLHHAELKPLRGSNAIAG